MAQSNEIRKGVCLRLDGKLMRVIDFQHDKMAQRQAVVRTKMKDVSNGRVLERTFRGNEEVEIIEISCVDMQLLYKDMEGYHFMNQKTFDQVTVTAEVLGDAVNYLRENDTVKLDLHEGYAVGIDLPSAVNLKVIEAPPAVRGNTANAATKPVKLETGLMVNVPLFIVEGEVLRIDTRTGDFLGRA